MSEHLNNSPNINPNPIPPELEAYEKTANQAETAAFRALATETTRGARAYDRAISALGTEVVRDANDENKLWGKHHPKKGVVEAADLLNEEIAGEHRRIGEEAVRAAAFNTEVADVGEDLRPGETSTFEPWGIAEEAEDFLADPDQGETWLRNSKPLDEEQAELVHQLMGGLDVEDDMGASAEEEVEGFSDDYPDQVTRQHFDDNRSLYPSLSQKAENLRQRREAASARKKNLKANKSSVREMLTQEAIAGNWTLDEVWDRWFDLTYDTKSKPGSDFYVTPQLKYENGRVSGVDFPDKKEK